MDTKNRILQILLVEDNPNDVLLARKALENAKLANNITVVGDGEKALAILRHEKEYASLPAMDIVLLDLNLPKKTGQEVLKEIKSDETLKHIPVVMLTGSRTELDVAQSYDLHANGYIVKPMNATRFTDMVQTMIWNRTIKLNM